MKYLALLLLLALGGCVTTGPGSVTGGECKVFDAPKYVVRGVRSYDQDWIDSTIEGGVGGCKWERPAPRPAELDATSKPAPAAVTKKKKPKAGWIWRARPSKGVWPTKVVVPAPEAPAPEPAALPPAPPEPRSPLDELLHPSEWVK